MQTTTKRSKNHMPGSEFEANLRQKIRAGTRSDGMFDVDDVLGHIAPYVDFEAEGGPKFANDEAEYEIGDLRDDAADSGDYLKAYAYQQALGLING